MHKHQAWNNKLIKDEKIVGGGQLCSLEFDRERKVVLGSKRRVAPAVASESFGKAKAGKNKTLIMVGSDVSGELHLGHLALLSVAQGLADYWPGKLIVSLNEIESVCSRQNNLRAVYENQKRIGDFLRQNNTAVHSRSADEALLMFAYHI